MFEFDDGFFFSELVVICCYFDVVYLELLFFGMMFEEMGVVEMWNCCVEFNFLMNVVMGFCNFMGFFKDCEICVEEWG